MLRIDINCDMAEGLANDAFLMPYISSANIACGYHAGDEWIMKKTVDLALQHTVSIGAHPGFDDKVNFGRTAMQLSPQQVYDLVAEQVFLLQQIALQAGARLHHVKPHGALYNLSAQDPALAKTIAQAVSDCDSTLILFGLSGSHSVTEAQAVRLRTASEVFADRTYQDDATLTPRNRPDAMVGTVEQAMQQAIQMIRDQRVLTVNGHLLPVVADTICIHGDGAHAVEFAKQISLTCKQNGIVIQSI